WSVPFLLQAEDGIRADLVTGVQTCALPIYTLTAAWQASMISPDLMRGTLPELARLQGKETNDWRDEQPGKMIHQVDTGPLAALRSEERRVGKKWRPWRWG